MSRSLGLLFALSLPAVLFACSSSSGGGTTTTTTSHGGSSTTTSSATTSGTTTATTTTTTTTGAGGAPVCEQGCTTSQPAAYAKFQTYALTDCGCASGSPCATDCASACPSGTPSSACTSCLTTQENMATPPACVTSAGETCLSDTVCEPFVGCELACME